MVCATRQREDGALSLIALSDFSLWIIWEWMCIRLSVVYRLCFHFAYELFYQIEMEDGAMSGLGHTDHLQLGFRWQKAYRFAMTNGESKGYLPSSTFDFQGLERCLYVEDCDYDSDPGFIFRGCCPDEIPGYLPDIIYDNNEFGSFNIGGTIEKELLRIIRSDYKEKLELIQVYEEKGVFF